MDTPPVMPSPEVMAAIASLKSSSTMDPTGTHAAIERASNDAASQLLTAPPQMGGADATTDAAAQTLAKGLVDASTDASAMLPEVVNQAAPAKKNFRKLFLGALFVAAAGVPSLKAGREMMVADAELPFRQKLFVEDCSLSAANTATIQDLSMKATLDASKPFGSFFSATGEQAERTVALEHARKVQGALQQACSSSEASFTIAVAAVTAARTAFTNSAYTWLAGSLAAAGITIATIMTAATDASKGNTAALAAMVNEEDEPVPMEPPMSPIGVPAFPDLGAPGAPTKKPRSRGGRRTYRKAKRSGKTRKGRR
jgi:hypothetical protein